jgi:recombination associated protein RdgC
MWFKNLALFRFTEPFVHSSEALLEALERRRFRPCGPLEMATLGWHPPLRRDDHSLVHAASGFLMLSLLREEKILPASVVNEAVEEKTEEIETRRGTPVGRKERATLRDKVVSDLIPRAFSHTRRTYAYIDSRGGWLVVDSPNPRRAEDLVSLLRQSLGSFPVEPLSVKERPASVMTRWLMTGQLPSDIGVEDECELRAPDEEGKGGIVRCRRQDLTAPEILNHLAAGKEVVRLALTWNDRLSLMLDDSLQVKKLRFLDGIQEQAAEVDAADEVERFDADFAIMALELSQFLERLPEWFGGENRKGR